MDSGSRTLAPGAITILGAEHADGRYLYGLTQPFLQAGLRFELPARVDWRRVDAALLLALPGAEAPTLTPDAPPLLAALERVLHWTPVFQHSAGDKTFEAGRLLWRAGDGGELAVLALPTLDGPLATAALSVVVHLVNRGLADDAAPAEQLAKSAQPHLAHLAGQRSLIPISPEMAYFLAKAHERGMPWLRLGTTGVFQIGYGTRGRWLDITVTDQTSLTSSKIARNKAAAASVMRQAGLPTPAHLAVVSEDMAVSAANSLGYPVVLKAANLDGGKGVHVGLRTADAVRKAYQEVRPLSDRILVEAFVEGRDYRLTVFHDKVIWVVERLPGSVTGDGVSSVRQLVDEANEDPRRHPEPSNEMIVLTLDSEALRLLEEQGLGVDSVPGEGAHVRLRGAANVGRGGELRPAFDHAHPDNMRLAERAARALRLDVAGIDLIIPDIAQSWKDVGGAICEINSGPGLGFTVSGHVYGQMLEGLVQGDGRIPIALAVGAGPRATALTARILAAAGLHAGRAASDGVWIGEEAAPRAPTDPFAAARMLLGDAAVGAAVVAVNDASPAKTGLPFDRCSVLALAGSRLATMTAEEFAGLARSLLPMAASKVVINAGDDGCVAMAASAPAGAVILYADHADDPRLARHRAAGGAAVWLEASAQGPCLVLAPTAGRETRIPLGDPGGFECTPADVALAAAMAGAMGCGEGHLRKGLAGVQVTG